MLTKKSLIVLILILFSLTLVAYSPGESEPTSPPLGLVLSAAEGGIEGGASTKRGIAAFTPLNATNTYTHSIYLPIIIDDGQQTTTSSYTIVDTDQSNCYNTWSAISCPQSGASFYGQDAQYDGVQPSYVDNGDGTVTDLNTGLMWQKDPGDKVTYNQAVAGASTLNLAGYDDWRLPSIKELYSLILFSGTDPSGCVDTATCDAVPFIDTNYFDFEYGDTSIGERVIDAQYWSSTQYVSTTMWGSATAFGVNFADGRIKGYGYGPGGPTEFVRYVRGNSDYGVNDFIANGDGAVSDLATGLMWQQADSGSGYNWAGALNYCEGLSLAGHDDWRLPNAKELQSIVDYTRSPDTSNSAAIDPIFSVTSIIDEGGNTNYPFYWTSTTHANMFNTGTFGVYVAFGEALGWMNGVSLLDVHGAGAQRSDPKDGDPANWPTGNGPQGDVVRIYNYARCVRDGGGDGGGNTASGGFNLFTPLGSTTTYLMDNDHDTVYTWASDYTPGNSVYLLENGNLLRTGKAGSTYFAVGGAGGIVQEIAPDSTVLWEFEYADGYVRQHHDIEPLPNGNVLMIAWEYKTQAEAIAAGRNPSLLSQGELWPDHVIEVDPTSNSIVWEWHIWDHLIQDYDPAQANYGVVADHPELIDLNFSDGGPAGSADWTHINAIDYNETFDQVLLSVRNFSEIWVIDHSTTTAEAAGHSGGNSGQGGDLLYRWGNPQAYDAGSAAEQQFFVQHDAQWIPSGYPGEGNILVFNNGAGRPGGNYSSVDEIVPPVDGSGHYTLATGSAYGPNQPTWTYTAASPTDFYASHISGAQRLANGNTLICDGPNGTFFEVTPGQDIVWTYDHEGQVFRVTRYAADYPGLPG
jgi:hypothetical protein